MFDSDFGDQIGSYANLTNPKSKKFELIFYQLIYETFGNIFNFLDLLFNQLYNKFFIISNNSRRKYFRIS